MTIEFNTGSDASLDEAVKSRLLANPDTNTLSDADITKLGGIAAGATVNATDADLRDRSTHTGQQAADTITGLSVVATSGSYADLIDTPVVVDGADGASAYDVAVAGGFIGSEAAWLASLVGADGQSVTIRFVADQAAFDAAVSANDFDWVILNA